MMDQMARWHMANVERFRVQGEVINVHKETLKAILQKLKEQDEKLSVRKELKSFITRILLKYYVLGVD